MRPVETQFTIDRINAIVSAANIMDFHVRSFDGDTLMLTGSFDHCYYHELEIYFHVASYIGLPVYGLDLPSFSIASAPDRELHSHLQLDETDILFKLHSNADFEGGYHYFVAAERLSIVEGIVYYYHRENLKAGERIADWVKREG